MTEEIHEDQSERKKKVQELVAICGEKLSMISGEIFAEKKNREEAYDNLIKRIGGHILRINNLVNVEKKQRIETHGEFMSVLDELYNKLFA